jgi:hypothetical protein
VPATLAPADLAAWLEERFPLRGGRVSIELVADDQDRLVYENEKGTLVAILRLINWDVDAAGERQTVRDIKEQHVYLLGPDARDEPERVRVFVEAWTSIMPEVLAALDEAGDYLMPHELVDFSPLGLARAETFDDFRRALLVKSRYGRFLVNRRQPLSPL